MSDAIAQQPDPITPPNIAPLMLLPGQRFSPADLHHIRRIVGARALEAGTGAAQAAALRLVATELVSHLIRRCDGWGEFAMWIDDVDIFVQVTDRGAPCDGRPTETSMTQRRPTDDLGLQLVDRVAESVTWQTGSYGTSVTAHLR